MATLAIKLLGGFQARTGEADAILLPGKAQALLAYLAAHPGQPQARDKLATLLWPESQEARHSLRQTLFTLRKVLAPVQPSVLHLSGPTIALNAAAVEIDVHAFEGLIREGTVAALERATTMYQGDFLEGLEPQATPFEEWLQLERERLREVAVQGLARLLAHQTKTNAFEAAIQTGIRLLGLEPFEEAVHRALMRLYVRTGRRGMALRQYQLCLEVLRRELGVEPEPGTKSLYAEILQPRQAAEVVAAEARLIYPERRRRRRRAQTSWDTDIAEAPLIGRAAELRRLAERLQEALRGCGRFVLMLGEAGIGKSRLVKEIEAEGLRRDCRLLFGRSYEAEQVLPFGPWVEAIRAGGVLGEGEILASLSPVWRAELARLLPELGRLPSAAAPSTEDYFGLFEALAELVRCLASRGPVVLIIEDVHWADEMSVGFLRFLGRRIHAWPVLMVATARDEEVTEASPLRALLNERGSGEPDRLPLAPLSRQETMVLARALARAGDQEGLTDALGERLWTLSEGNPFVVVETVRALREGGPPPSPDAVPLPSRVQEVTARRLDRLSEAGQRLVTVAAVIGREFEFALLCRAARLDARDVASALEEAVRRQVLRERGERFDFTHERIRAVAYGRLIGPQRKLLHAAVASSLEELHAGNLEPHYAALARHFREGEIWDKAVTYLRGAGHLALLRAAPREAMRFLEGALADIEHLPPGRERTELAIDLRLDLRNALVPLGELARVFEHLGRAEALARDLGDQRRLGHTYALMSYHCVRATGEPDRALGYGERVLVIADSLNDFDLQVRANHYLGYAHHARGSYREAAAHFLRNVGGLPRNRVRDRFGLSGLPSVFSRVYLAYSLAELGEFSAALDRAEEARHIAEGTDDPYHLLGSDHGLGHCLVRQGDLQRAIPLLERSLELCRTRTVAIWLAHVAATLGYAYALQGRVSEALPLLEEALDHARRIRVLYGHAEWLSWLGEAYLAAARLLDASALAEAACRHTRAHGERGNQAYALHLLGEVGASSGASDAAEGHYLQSMALADELGMRPLVAHCHRSLADLCRSRGRVAEGNRHLGAALALYREMRMHPWRAGMELDVMSGERT